MALGDSVGVQAVNAAVAQLPGIEKFTDYERAQLTATMLQMWSQIPGDLAPVVAQMAVFNQNIVNLQATLDKITGQGVRATLSMGGTFMDFTLIPAKAAGTV
jgi:hypothetical protein